MPIKRADLGVGGNLGMGTMVEGMLHLGLVELVLEHDKNKNKCVMSNYVIHFVLIM